MSEGCRVSSSGSVLLFEREHGLLKISTRLNDAIDGRETRNVADPLCPEFSGDPQAALVVLLRENTRKGAALIERARDTHHADQCSVLVLVLELKQHALSEAGRVFGGGRWFVAERAPTDDDVEKAYTLSRLERMRHVAAVDGRDQRLQFVAYLHGYEVLLYDAASRPHEAFECSRVVSVRPDG